MSKNEPTEVPSNSQSENKKLQLLDSASDPSISTISAMREKVITILAREKIFVSLSHIQNMSGMSYGETVAALRYLYQSNALEHILGNGAGNSRYRLKSNPIDVANVAQVEKAVTIDVPKAIKPIQEPIAIQGLGVSNGRVVISMSRRLGGLRFSLEKSQAKMIAQGILSLDASNKMDLSGMVRDTKVDSVTCFGSLVIVRLDKRPSSKTIVMLKSQAIALAKKIIAS